MISWCLGRGLTIGDDLLVSGVEPGYLGGRPGLDIHDDLDRLAQTHRERSDVGPQLHAGYIRGWKSTVRAGQALKKFKYRKYIGIQN